MFLPGRMAYAVSYDLLKDVHLAEDAVQEALHKLSEPIWLPCSIICMKGVLICCIL